MSSASHSLDGQLLRRPFSAGGSHEHVARSYESLVDTHGADRVLLLKRFPTGIDELSDTLATTVESIHQPEIAAVASHAREVVRSQRDPPAILNDVDRRELASEFIEDQDWKSPYLQRASQQDAFVRDVARLMNVISWWGQGIQTDNPELDEIHECTIAFREWLDDAGYCQRGDLIARASTLLQTDPEVGPRIRSQYDAVLVVEFEEFGPVERQYLAQLTPESDLVCLAEAHSSIQRTWNEGGEIGALCAGLDQQDTQQAAALTTKPAVVATYLATGDVATSPDSGHVSVIAEPTFEEQVSVIADEIQRLRASREWAYDDFAIGVKDAKGPITKTVRQLRQAGIPTASATVSGFGDDTVVRELLALSQYLATGDDQAWHRLEAAVSVLDESVVESLAKEGTLEGALRRWALETDLKERIAASEPPLDARTQFSHAKEVFDVAGFLDETPFLDATWARLTEAVERSFTRSAIETSTAPTDVQGEGVVVDAVRVLKNASWKAVFMLNVVEGEYPSAPNLTRLFPEATVNSLDGYPGVTTPTATDVHQTFPTAPDSIETPFRQYYAELSHRLLAVGARSATDRLYFGIYDEEDAATGKRTQPSRFLLETYRTFPWLGTHSTEGIHGQSGATQFALSRVDTALREIRRAPITGASVDLTAVERDLGSIQRLLETGDEHGDRLRAAVKARVDFAAGRVRNE